MDLKNIIDYLCNTPGSKVTLTPRTYIDSKTKESMTGKSKMGVVFELTLNNMCGKSFLIKQDFDCDKFNKYFKDCIDYLRESCERCAKLKQKCRQRKFKKIEII